MNRVDPTFRYPPERPPPRGIDLPLVIGIVVVTILILLGWTAAALRMSGWL